MSSIEFLGLALALSFVAGLARGRPWAPPRFAGARAGGRARGAEQRRTAEVVSPPDFWLRERPRPAASRAGRVAAATCCAASASRGRS